MWADIMGADIYEAFVAGGLDNDASIKKLGLHFRETFPSLGGSVAPAEVFRQMMGRDPDVSAMLKYNGLLAKA
jgi:oligopeptidase A